MKHIVYTLISTPLLWIFFAYTKANIYSFWLGVFLCLMIQLAIFIVYCGVKLHRAHRASINIKLENPPLNFESQYPMPKLEIAKDIYLNKYTEEARLTNKKQSLQEPQFQADFQEISFDKVRYKERVQKYLEQIRNQYSCLNYFNQALIDFGNRMKLISEKSLIFYGTFYEFTAHQTCFINESFQAELQPQQKKAFFKQLKITLKRPKTQSNALNMTAKKVEELQNIVLPSWAWVMNCLGKVGEQFRQLQGMKHANSQYLEMVHRNIIEDYEIIEKQITNSISTISKIKSNLEALRCEHQKLEKYETTSQGNDNIQIIYWLKKQFFEFTNLDLRIKKEQKLYKEHTEEIIYYQAKLASFYKKQKSKYQSIIQTRSYAFLDSYRITLEQSLAMLKNAFKEEGYNYGHESGPPKVKELAKSKNINEIVNNQRQYQQQYFQRVDYYLRKIPVIKSDLEQMDIFLSKFRSIFCQFKHNLALDPRYTQLDTNQQRKALIFDSLIKQLGQQLTRIIKIISNLANVNQQFSQGNNQALSQTEERIRQLCDKAKFITHKLTQTEGPLKERYRMTRQQLNNVYRDVEENISAVREFQKMFQLHYNRIKKIIISSMTTFVANQKKLVMSYINSDAAFKKKLNQSQFDDLNEQEPTKEDKPAETIDLNIENSNSLQTGVVFCEEYRTLLNRFFFVAYTEWSKSQAFRDIITEEIYIALNEDVNEYFEEIVIEDFEATGLPPSINWLKELKYQQGEFIMDFNLSFRGRLVIKLSTKVNFVTSFQVEFELAIEQFYATLRLCFVHNDIGRSWVSFVGEPVAKIIAKPKIGNVSLNSESVANLLQKVILDKLKQMIYPIKKKLMIPLYKKDEAYSIIRRRFESMAMV